jgi:hypothetical protein
VTPAGGKDDEDEGQPWLVIWLIIAVGFVAGLAVLVTAVWLDWE